MTQPTRFVRSGPIVGIVVVLALAASPHGREYQVLAEERDERGGAERLEVGSYLGQPTRIPRTRRVSESAWLRMVQNAIQPGTGGEPPPTPSDLHDPDEPEVPEVPLEPSPQVFPFPGAPWDYSSPREEWESDEEPEDDPTRPSPSLREVLEAEAEPPVTPGVTRSPQVEIPEIQVKARVVMDSQVEAVLEVDGRLLRVVEGDELQIRGSRGGLVRLHVKEIHERGVRLQFPPLPGVVSF